MVARLGLLLATAFTALFAAVPAAVAEPPAPPAPIIPPPVQPANIGDLKSEAIQYYDSGAYLTDLQLATAPAIAWINEEAPRAQRSAVVFDIDETALSNWEAIKANDFGRVIGGPCDSLPKGPCGWLAWDLRAQSTDLAQTHVWARKFE
jgi:acid phosphatase